MKTKWQNKIIIDVNKMNKTASNRLHFKSKKSIMERKPDETSLKLECVTLKMKWKNLKLKKQTKKYKKLQFRNIVKNKLLL